MCSVYIKDIKELISFLYLTFRRNMKAFEDLVLFYYKYKQVLYFYAPYFELLVPYSL